MANEKESVVNFLTPTKLITGSLRQGKGKLNANQSQYTHFQVQQKEALHDSQSRNYNSQFQKINYRRQSSHQDNQNSGADTLEAKQRNQPFGKNYVLQNTSKTVLKSENNFKTAQQRIQTRSVQMPTKPAFQIYKVEQTKDYKDQYIKQKISSASNSRVKLPYNKDQYGNDGKQSRGWEKHAEGMANLIQQLKRVKQVIDLSLVQLQNCLDNTSEFLKDIDVEYMHIKQRLLDYTGQVLDAGFRKYKQNMVNWTKYEDVEKRAILVTEQLHKTILQEQVTLESSRVSKGSRVTAQKQQQLLQKLQKFQQFSIQIQTAKVECVSMRPQLKKAKIINFQQALITMADF